MTTPARSLNGGMTTAERIDSIFGSDIFSRSIMRQRLPKDVYRSLLRTIDQGEPLDPAVADVVAASMKDWAIENGATHYTHWFQPRRIVMAVAMANRLVTTASLQICVW